MRERPDKKEIRNLKVVCGLTDKGPAAINTAEHWIKGNCKRHKNTQILLFGLGCCAPIHKKIWSLTKSNYLLCKIRDKGATNGVPLRNLACNKY